MFLCRSRLCLLRGRGFRSGETPRGCGRDGGKRASRSARSSRRVEAHRVGVSGARSRVASPCHAPLESVHLHGQALQLHVCARGAALAAPIARVRSSVCILQSADMLGDRERRQPDGWGWRGQLGLLMPHTDVEPDSEFAALAPDGVSVIAMRVRWVGVAGAGGAMTRYGGDAARAFVDSPRLDEAVDTLVDAPLSRPQAIGLSFTGSSYVLGPDGDIALKARLEARARGVPIAITCLAAVAALRAFGARRVALIHPPWFAEGMDPRGATYFKQQGFDVVYRCVAPATGLGIARPVQCGSFSTRSRTT